MEMFRIIDANITGTVMEVIKSGKLVEFVICKVFLIPNEGIQRINVDFTLETDNLK